MMKEEILSNLENPVQLERLYRSDKPAFKQAFKTLSPEIRESQLGAFWNARLDFVTVETIRSGSSNELVLTIVACLVAGLVAKLPAILSIDEEFFYTRNAGYLVFPFLSAYFAWKNKLSAGKLIFVAGAMLAGLVFINLLPAGNESDTLRLSCIHLLLFLWSVLGFAFAGGPGNEAGKRLGFLQYNGDLVVITTLILIAGAILTGITIGLFTLIGFDIERFYFENIVIFALPAAPILGTYLIRSNPQLVGRISPLIARIFSPLVLVTLVIYLVAMISSGKDPYNDREFLLLFNALLIGVMAIIFFVVAGTTRTQQSSWESWVSFLLAFVTIIVNSIALSAILFRISEWGLTPNRAAVLGGNVLILVNLVWVTIRLFRVVTGKGSMQDVETSISRYLPVYCLWAIIVTFLFPFLFGFK
jgi:hypothetical protein